ncbi:MAG: YkgJ family cysteine cluster protein [Deltaproteobacteria bacterium]|nr:YkgJ family cysteine cluster protein [Deltaproteobacteria bacterium]
MKLAPFFHNYELLVDKAEAAFHNVKEKYGDCVKCELHCSDCCNAVFGVFLVEALYIRSHFEQIKDNQKLEALERAKLADKAIEDLQKKLKTFEGDPQMQTYTLARERIRCPLLDDNDECVLYHKRPVTCRVYGIPAKIHGKTRACGKAKFKNGETYPILDLDSVYRDMYILSRDILEEAKVQSKDEDKASLLISISKVIQTPVNDLIEKDFQ